MSTECMMVILTMIYVLTTLGLSYLNYRSFKISEKLLIATLESQTQQQKMQLFELRYVFYKDLEKAFKEDVLGEKTDFTFIKAYADSLRDRSKFLFGKDIHDYMLEIVNKASVTNVDENGNDSGIKMVWFESEIAQKKMRDRFLPYLNLSDLGKDEEVQ